MATRRVASCISRCTSSSCIRPSRNSATHHHLARSHSNSLSPAAQRHFTTGGIMICVGYNMVHKQSTKSSHCLAEGIPSTKPRRRRPPIFGPTVPKITSRGLVTNASNDSTTSVIPTDISDREDCPLCKKFGSGPCGDIFKTWLACTDKHPGKYASSGEPIHLSKCADLAEKLAKCLDEHQEYYTKYDEKNNKQKEDNAGKSDGADIQELKDAWKDFVESMEERIASNKYKLHPYQQDINPTMQVRIESGSGAVFFKPETKNGQPLLAAYLLDDRGSVIAAGSKDDMDMGGLGCVLQFKIGDNIQSAKVRSIYDAGGDSVDDIEIFSRTYKLIPRSLE